MSIKRGLLIINGYLLINQLTVCSSIRNTSLSSNLKME